jgi:hypothetical protein
MSQSNNPFEVLSSDEDFSDEEHPEIPEIPEVPEVSDDNDANPARRQRAMAITEMPVSQLFNCDFNPDPDAFTQEFINLLLGGDITDQVLLHSLVEISGTTNDTLNSRLNPQELTDYIKKIQTTPFRDIDTSQPDVENNPICDYRDKGKYGIEFNLKQSKRAQIDYLIPYNTIGPLYEKEKDTTHNLISLPKNFIDQVNVWETKLLKIVSSPSKIRNREISHINRKESISVEAGRHYLPPLYFLLVNPEFHGHHSTVIFYVDNKFYSIGVGYSGNYVNPIPAELLGTPSLYTPDYMFDESYTIVDIGIVRKSHLEKLQRYIQLITTIHVNYKFLTDAASQVTVMNGKITGFKHPDIDHSIYSKSVFCILKDIAYCAAARESSTKVTNCTNFITYVFSDRITCRINKLHNEKHGELNSVERAMILLGRGLGSVDPAYCHRREGLVEFTNEHIKEIFCSLSEYLVTGKIKKFLNLIKYNHYESTNGYVEQSVKISPFFVHGGIKRTRKIKRTRRTRKIKRTRRTRKIRKSRKIKKTKKH